MVIDQIGQLSRDVIGRLSVKRAVKPWCYRLWRLVMSSVRFDPSIVTVCIAMGESQLVRTSCFIPGHRNDSPWKIKSVCIGLKF